MAEGKYRILYGDDIFQSFKGIHDYIASDSDERAASTIEKLLDDEARKAVRIVRVEHGSRDTQ